MAVALKWETLHTGRYMEQLLILRTLFINMHSSSDDNTDGRLL